MSGLPALRAAQSDHERAQLLLSEPLFDLFHDWSGWWIECRRAGFGDGVAYLDAFISAVAKRRYRGEFADNELTEAKMPLLQLVDGGG